MFLRRLQRDYLVCLAVVAGLLLLAAAGCRREDARDPAQRLASGWNWYCEGNFGLAEREFSAALARVPTNCPLRQQILHGLATTWDLRRPGEDKVRAAEVYRDAIAIAPTNDLSAWCWLALACLQAQPQGGDTAVLKTRVDAFQQVIDHFPFHPAGEEAFLRQQAAILEKPQAEAARRSLDALDRFLREHPQSPWRSQAWRLVNHCCTVLERKDRRLEAAQQEWKTQEVDPLNPTPDRSWTYWQIATIAEFDVGDFPLAREQYRKLIAEYPMDQKVFLAKQELKHMDEVEEGVRNSERGIRNAERGASKTLSEVEGRNAESAGTP